MHNAQNITTNDTVQYLLERGIYTITPRELATFLQVPPSRAHYLVQKLKARGWIQAIGGRYLVTGFEPYRLTTRPFFVAVSLVTPSYISFLTALNRYGLTEQVPFTIFVATTVKHKPIRFGQYEFRYVLLKPSKFFGYSKQMEDDLPILMADPEKAVVDSFDQIRYRYGGGVQDLTKALVRGSQGAFLDPVQLVDYALRMGNKALCARLGYLARLVELSSSEVERLKGCLPKGFVPLDPARPLNSQWNAEWRINVNVTSGEMFDWLEGVR